MLILIAFHLQVDYRFRLLDGAMKMWRNYGRCFLVSGTIETPIYYEGKIDVSH